MILGFSEIMFCGLLFFRTLVHKSDGSATFFFNGLLGWSNSSESQVASEALLCCLWMCDGLNLRSTERLKYVLVPQRIRCPGVFPWA